LKPGEKIKRGKRGRHRRGRRQSLKKELGSYIYSGTLLKRVKKVDTRLEKGGVEKLKCVRRKGGRCPAV